MTSPRFSAVFVALCCIFGSAQSVAQQPPPKPVCSSTQSPAPGWYRGTTTLQGGVCPQSYPGLMNIDYPNNTAPKGLVNGVMVPVKLICENIGAPYNLCEAYPMGDGLSYSWTASNATFPNPANPTEPTRLVRCNGQQTGSVTVTVYSPQGNGASATAQVSCVGAPH